MTIDAYGKASTSSVPQPFLRWAGGKTWFARRFADQLSALSLHRYHEPFLGGGSVFFALPNGIEAYLSDENAGLISTYRMLRDRPREVISVLKGFKNSERDYYAIRSNTFETDEERAAQFIYLNQTSYNGIYRVNLNGVYNVPYGHRTKEFCDEDTLVAASKKLKSTHLSVQDFEQALSNVRRRDFVFIDPPYTVSHNRNGFIKYNSKLFSLDDYSRLRKCIFAIKTAGAYYLLTNAAHEKVREIFDFGDQVVELERASLIGGKNATRGRTKELLFTNLEGVTWAH